MTAYSVFIACVVGLLAACSDVSVSWTSPVLPQMHSNDSSLNPIGRPITDNEDAWISSLVTIGAMIGPLPVGYLSQKLGRKIGLLFISCPLIIGFFTLAFTSEILLIYISRVLCGVSVGSSYALTPLYLAEISQDHNRGMISQVINVSCCLGSFISYTVGSYASYKVFNLYLAMIPTAFFILFLICAPETPYYLLSVKRVKEAEKELALLRSTDKDDVQEEIEHIRKQLYEKDDHVYLSEIFQNRALKRAFIISIVLISAQELSGFVTILFYMQPIFEAADTGLSANISSIVVAFFLFVTSFICPFIVDKYGRRLPLIGSLFALCVSLFLLGLFFYIQSCAELNARRFFWLPIVSLILYIFAFNFGISSIPTTIFSEIFPNNCKNYCSTIVSSYGWGLSFIVTRNFNLLNLTIGRYGTFWFFSTCCFANAIFCIFCVPETKGKCFAAIQEDLRSQSLFQLGITLSSKSDIEKCASNKVTLELS